MTFTGLPMRSVMASACALSMMAASPVLAAPEDDLAQEIMDGMMLYFGQAAGTGNFEWIGDSETTEKDGVYHVKLPELSIAVDVDHFINMGEIMVTYGPVGAETSPFTVTFPEELFIHDSAWKESYKVTFGKQDIEGTWSEKLDTLVGLDMDIEDLILAPESGGEQMMVIENIDYSTMMREGSDGLYDGPANMMINNIIFNDTDMGVGLAIEEAKLISNMEDYDLATYVSKVLPKMKELAEMDPNEMTADDIRDSMGAFWNLFGGMDADFEISNITATEAGEEVFSLDNVGMEMMMKGLNSNMSSIALAVDHDGLMIKSDDPMTANYTPVSSEFSISIEKLPTDELRKAFGSFLKDMEAQGEDAAGMALTNSLMPMLSSAGSHIKINRIGFEMPNAGANLTGKVMFDSQAAFGVTANMDLALRGMEETMTEMSEMAGQGSAMGQELMGVMMMMTMFQAMGQVEEQDGNKILRYKLDVAKEGDVMLNGQDMSQMMGGMAPQ